MSERYKGWFTAESSPKPNPITPEDCEPLWTVENTEMGVPAEPRGWYQRIFRGQSPIIIGARFYDGLEMG